MPSKNAKTRRAPAKKPAKNPPKTEVYKGTVRVKRNAALTGKPAGTRTRKYTITATDTTKRKK